MEKESFVIRIGPKLRKVLDIQIKIVNDITYGVCNSSDWEAGEIIADKVLKERLLE